MECATAKPSSSISEMVSKFARVCKLRSIGVFSSEYPNHHHHNPSDNNNDVSVGKDGSAATEETECDGEKIYPRPVVVPSKSKTCGEGDIIDLFDKISALKLAYVRLQDAHIPYEPDKIVAADEVVMAQLEALCNIKRVHKEKYFTKGKPNSTLLDCLRAEVKVNERLLQKLKSQNGSKDDEIERLRQELHELDLGNAILAEKIRQNKLKKNKVRILNISMFEDTFKTASSFIHDFAKPLISLMKASGWDLHLAANSIESGVPYSKRSDRKYAFEAYIARRMFHSVSLKSYSVDDVLRFDDPVDYLIANPNSEFANFCGKKYLFVVHPVMEMSFFGNLDHRMFVLSGKHPRTPFYQMFARVAKWVWILQGIATSIDPSAEIFSVHRGCKFSDIYMEPVEENKEGVIVSNGGQSNCKVEFMIMPGFRIEGALVKSRVYLSVMKPSPGTC